jgi:hypothetical protein
MRRLPSAQGVRGSTVYRTKRRFVPGNLEAPLSEEPRPGPAAARWTLALLADELVRLTERAGISHETVRRD